MYGKRGIFNETLIKISPIHYSFQFPSWICHFYFLEPVIHQKDDTLC